ncbi:MAG: hypothetical protein ACRD27_12670 [Terracidiphilus sp.]
MKESIEAISKLIDEGSEEDRKALKVRLRELLPHPLEREWDIDADTILSAINRSSDLTRRGVRGIIAEAVFVDEVCPTVSAAGWECVVINGDHPFDALLQKGDLAVRIQVKLQRLEAGVPKLYYPKHYEKGSLFVVEVQKTRTGTKAAKKTIPITDAAITANGPSTVKTRPYNFGDFDILAVNMHPSSGNWKNFRYTLASWLLPRSLDKKLIEIFQPVAAIPNGVWTDDLATCLTWFERGEQFCVLTELLHRGKSNKE